MPKSNIKFAGLPSSVIPVKRSQLTNAKCNISDKRFKVTQYNIRQTGSSTVHNAQGMTLSQIIVGCLRKSIGFNYTVLSRARCFNDIWILSSKKITQFDLIIPKLSNDLIQQFQNEKKNSEQNVSMFLDRNRHLFTQKQN